MRLARFIVVGDIQFRGVNPVARKDDFTAALAAKIDEVHQKAREFGADAILQVGDLFDSPMTSYSVLLKLMVLLQMAPCPWVTIPGNHDLFGSNKESYPRTPMAVLEQAGVVEVLHNNTPIFINGMDFCTIPTTSANEVCMTGRGFDWEMDTHPSTHEAPTNSDIHITHGMLLTSPLPIDIKHTLIKDVQTNARVTLCGHDHLGFGIIRRDDGKLFINPGALCRESAHAAEIERTVQVCLLEVTKEYEHAEMVPIECARPGDEVLSREHIDKKAMMDERMNYFLELIKQDGESKFLETREIIDNIAERESLPLAVKDDALKRIAFAREELARR